MTRGFVVAALVAFSAPVLGAALYVADSEESAAVAETVRPARVIKASERKFIGLTSQEKDFGFRLSRDGRRIELLKVTYVATCLGKNGMEMELADRLYTPIAVAADGTFAVRNLGKRISVHGRIANGKASGAFRIKMVYGGLMSCLTDPIRFSAHF